MTERMFIPAQVDIECAVARHWPDIGAVMAATGATRTHVDTVLRRLEAINEATHRDHECREHPAGSTLCYAEHHCRCDECKTATARAAQHRARVVSGDMLTELDLRRLRQAHAAYRRGNRDPNVIAGHREYHRLQEAERKQRRKVEREQVAS